MHTGYTAHFNNLSFKVTEEFLLKYCEDNFGPVLKINLVLDYRGKSKGFAFVEFKDKEGLDKAIETNEIMLLDRMAIIKKSLRPITS